MVQPRGRERSLANLILTNFSAELIFGELLGESALQDLIWAWFVLLLVSYCLHLLVKTLELRRQRPFYKLSETVKASLRVPLSLQDKQPHKSCSASRADAEGRMRVLPWHSLSPFTSQSGVSLTHKKLRQVHWVVGSKSRSSGARLQAVIANIKRPPQSWTTGPLWSLQSSFRWKQLQRFNLRSESSTLRVARVYAVYNFDKPRNIQSTVMFFPRAPAKGSS